MRDNETRRPAPQAEADGLIEGRNAVIEALRAGTAIDKIYLAKGETDKTLGHIASRAREAGVASMFKSFFLQTAFSSKRLITSLMSSRPRERMLRI